MCYKDEIQKKNAEKLHKKFEQDHIPDFIIDYFYNLNSEAGKLNYYSIILSMLNWMIEKKRINCKSLSEITEQDINSLSKTDIIVYLETLITNGLSPSTINTKKNVLSSFWSHLVDEGVCDRNIVHSIPKSKFKIKKKNNAKVPFPEDRKSVV